MSIRGFAASFVLFASFAGAQNVPTRTVGKASVELEEPFSGILEIRELRSGAVVVLDGKDNVLQVVSPDLGSVAKVSREGSGPLEYRRLTQLLGRAGDSTLAYDVMNARFLVLDAKGAPTGTISLREAAGGLPVGPTAVRGYDASGRLYYQGMKFAVGPDGPAISDSMYILRLDPKSKKVDTLGHARAGVPSIKMSGDMQKGTGSVKLSMSAFPIVDEWSLLPDGQVVVVRGANYQLQFLGGATPRTLPPVAFSPVKVTEADKAKARKQLKEAEKEMQKAAASAAASIPRVQGQRMPGIGMDEPTEWPALKPAFTRAALKVAPNGEIWVRRLREASKEAELYDVFTPAGKLAYRVELPPKTKLVGFGARYLYLSREDEDELQYLGRYPRPIG